MNNSENTIEISAKDLSNASHIFARTINLLLEENEGIVINKTPDMILDEGVEKVVVFKHNNVVHIQRFDQDLEEGSLLTLEMETSQE